MNLKEAASYGSFLNLMIYNLRLMAQDETYTRRTTEFHNKEKSNPEAENEILEIKPENKLDITSDKLIELSKELIEEKLDLNFAIYYAKDFLLISLDENNTVSLDNAISYNKQLRELIESCNYLSKVKNSETKRTQYGYKFNVEGNETSYQYECVLKKEIDFDKDKINSLNKELKIKTDKISTLIDQAQSSDVIKFEPKYSKYDSIEDIINR